MTAPQIQKINAVRLTGWAGKLSAAHATALVVVGVGHDQRNGEVNVCVSENGPSDREIAAFLRHAANLLDREGVARS